VKVESEALGLRLNVTETKLIKVGSYVSNQPLLVDGTEVECVDQFNFLGSLIVKEGGCANLGRQWNFEEHQSSFSQGLNFPNCYTYACETWTLTQADCLG
jgi:hypothetical protein